MNPAQLKAEYAAIAVEWLSFFGSLDPAEIPAANRIEAWDRLAYNSGRVDSFLKQAVDIEVEIVELKVQIMMRRVSPIINQIKEYPE